MGESKISMSFVPPAVKTLFAEETTVAVPVAVVAADIELRALPATIGEDFLLMLSLSILSHFAHRFCISYPAVPKT
jgi:hypothetical protein